MKAPRFALCLMFILALTACGTSQEDKDKEAAEAEAKAKIEKQKEDAKRLICPQVAIIRDLGDIKDFGTQKPDAAELVAQAKMLGVQGKCEYQEEGIDITFELALAAAKGPRLGGLRAGFPYFVAVVAPDERILNKDKLTADFHFSSDSKIAEQTESLHIFVPLSKEGRALGPDYRVLMGFQLDEEQLNAVRSNAKN